MPFTPTLRELAAELTRDDYPADFKRGPDRQLLAVVPGLGSGDTYTLDLDTEPYGGGTPTSLRWVLVSKVRPFVALHAEIAGPKDATDEQQRENLYAAVGRAMEWILRREHEITVELDQQAAEWDQRNAEMRLAGDSYADSAFDVA